MWVMRNLAGGVRSGALLAAAGLLSVAAAFAQQAPITPDDVDKRLQERARLIQQVNPQGADRLVVYEMVWPKDAAEYQALGRNGFLLVTAVTKNAAELPMKKISVRVGEQEILLRKLWSHRSDTASGSPVRRLFGSMREDALFIVPGAPIAKGSSVFAEFALERPEFRPEAPAPAYVRATPGDGAEPNAAALKAFLGRQLPGFKIELKP